MPASTPCPSKQSRMNHNIHACDTRPPSSKDTQYYTIIHIRQPISVRLTRMTERIWKTCTFGNDPSGTWVLAHPFNGVHVQQIMNGGGVVVILIFQVSMDRGDARHRSPGEPMGEEVC